MGLHPLKMSRSLLFEARGSVRRFDEDQASGSNGLLRWTNDRGYLFAIPVEWNGGLSPLVAVLLFF